MSTQTTLWRFALTMGAIGLALFSAPSAVAQPSVLREVPQPGNAVVGTLSNSATEHLGLVLTAGARRSVAMRPNRDLTSQYWTLGTAGRDTVRLQLFEGGQFWSLAADAAGQNVGIERSADRVEQLWRIGFSRRRQGAMWLESVAFPGRFLMGRADGRVLLEPLINHPGIWWNFGTTAPPPVIVIPTQQLVEHTVVPNPPLPPAETTIVNSHRQEILVKVIDVRSREPRDVKLKSGERKTIALERDAGGTIIERYVVVDALGNRAEQRFSTPVPPRQIYELAVYERFLQSIAIDRTGKSPNVIEDVNYQPKSVGAFAIPAGDAFGGGELDAFKLAKRANNPGAVAIVDPYMFDEPEESRDRLQDILDGLQKGR